jgi:methylglyoxal synthase
MEHKTITTPKRSGRKTESVVALIAHDAKKADIVMFAIKHIETLSKCVLVATGSTGSMISDYTGLEVKLMLAGPDGGDLQIGGLIASGEIDMVIFFRDALTAQPHEPDISALMRVCDVHNVPLATNPLSANMLLRYLEHRPGSLRFVA